MEITKLQVPAGRRQERHGEDRRQRRAPSGDPITIATSITTITITPVTASITIINIIILFMLFIQCLVLFNA